MDGLFDTLAKGLATGGLSRRGALRGVAGAFGASLLAYVGIGCAPEAVLSAPGARRRGAPLEPGTPRPEVSPGSPGASSCDSAAYEACVGQAEAAYAAALPRCQSPGSTAAQVATCQARADAKRTADRRLCAPRAGCATAGDVCTSLGLCGPAVGPAPQTVAGTWTGAATLGPETLRLQFALTVAGTTLGGTARFWEPRSAQFLDVGAITGTISGATARWEIASGGVIAGTFSGANVTTFTGTLTFATEPGVPAMTAAVELTR